MYQRVASGLGWPRVAVLAGAATIAAVWGCTAGNWAELQGAVAVAGKPVAEGSIALVPIASTKGPSAGGFIAAGRYRLTKREGVRPGRFLVQLAANLKTGRMVEMPTFGGRVEEIVNIVPPEYGEKSTLEVEIRPGINTFDIAIP